MILLALISCSPPLPVTEQPFIPKTEDKLLNDTAIELIEPMPHQKTGTQVFDISFVHEVRITLSEKAINSLYVLPYEYVTGNVSFDGQELGEIGLRIKGRLGSKRTIYQKCAFKLDFNRIDPENQLDGLEKLNLNNMVQDNAMSHEWAAYTMYNSVGVPAPRVSYANVYINDSLRGLYTLVEAYDDVFLSNHYDDPTGNLYDGDYILHSNGSYTRIDFEQSTHDYFELDEGIDIKKSDIHFISESILKAYGNQDEFSEIISQAIDLDSFLRHWSTEVWVGQYDGYSFNINNYRVYFDPDDGLADLFPWDHDWAFYSSTPITDPSGRLSYFCKNNVVCHQQMLETLGEVSETIDSLPFKEQLESIFEMINPYCETDPYKEYSCSDVKKYQVELIKWIENRTSYLQGVTYL